MNNLFGWSNLQFDNVKERKFDNIFRNVNSVNKIIVAIDGSGSTTFTDTVSYDEMNFSQIYARALTVLHTSVIRDIVKQRNDGKCDFYGWSSEVKKFNSEYDIYINCIEAGIPFAEQIHSLNTGTEPFKLLPFMDNVATVLVTDGDIRQEQVLKIQANIKSVSSGPVFLVIVPHVSVYKNMYTKDVEANAIDNINITIPQAFAEKLACVLIWHHKKKNFELVKELTAPWLQPSVDENDLTSLFKGNLPLINGNSFLIKINENYRTFNIDELVNYVKDNKVESIENIIEKLKDYKISEAIIQQGSVSDREKFNTMCMALFNKGMNEHMSKFAEETSESTDILELIRLSSKNSAHKRRLENEYVQKYKTIFNNLMINKTVAEVNNIATAKTLQTRDNVKSFQSMAVTDKLSEICQILPIGECSICTEKTHVFKTVNIPASFFTHVSGSINSIQVKRKRNREATIKTLDVTAFKNCLSTHKPDLYYLDLCHGCANEAMKKARRIDDPEYGITNIVPQNIVGGRVINRLMLLPLVDPQYINENCNPNEPRLSFSRQIMRGFISKVTELEVAGQDTMLALLMFLTSLARDKETATLIYASQLSIFRGGAKDRFGESVGRLFKPTAVPISSPVLTQIMAVENVIELAEFNVLPESRKLLLLCLIERKIAPLVNAKQYREKSIAELTNLLTSKSESNTNKLISSYNFTREALEALIIDSSTLDISQFNSNIAFNLQQRGIHIDQMINCENNLKNILASTNADELATNLDIDSDYFKNIINKCNISDVAFIAIIPKFISALVNSSNNNNNNDAIMNIIINHVKILG